ncbi:MAG: Fic family protein, partial [Bacteroidota bacterium]|nr:Fic family protein [Bacteroidota bacterium]
AYVDIRDPVLGFYSAFIPKKLMEDIPAVDSELGTLEASASHALGSLDAIVDFLPDKNTFLFSYLRKEAVLSSQIEGTQSSISDLLLYENNETPGVPLEDVEEVSTYIQAVNHGEKALKSGRTIDQILIKELHAILLSKGRGSNKLPGMIRDRQNWVGGEKPGSAQYVPPPPGEALGELIDDFVFFMNETSLNMPPIRRAGIMHAQFESIHPFYDGNGRIGRMLLSLSLSQHGMLREPLLYLSLYLKHRRLRYYDLLQNVREESGWNDWLTFFYTGVTEVARGAHKTALELLALFENDKERIESNNAGRFSGTMIRVHELFKKKIIVAPKQIIEALDISAPTAMKAVRSLHQLGIITEITGKQRYSIYSYTKYLDRLNEGAEPI